VTYCITYSVPAPEPLCTLLSLRAVPGGTRARRTASCTVHRCSVSRVPSPVPALQWAEERVRDVLHHVHPQLCDEALLRVLCAHGGAHPGGIATSLLGLRVLARCGALQGRAALGYCGCTVTVSLRSYGDRMSSGAGECVQVRLVLIVEHWKVRTAVRHCGRTVTVSLSLQLRHMT